MNAYALVGIVAVIVIAVAAIGLKLYGRSQRKLGGSQAVAKGRGKVIENVDKAKRAVHDLDRDSDARDKLRKRHTRD